MIYCRRESDESYIKGTAHDNGFYSTADSNVISEDITLDLSSGSFDGSSLSDTGTFTFEGIESVFCGSGDDTLTGDDNDNYLNGTAGGDTLTGAGGNDVLFNAVGNDTVNGGSGDDLIYIYNSTGANTITGGDGADTFTFEHWTTPPVHVIKDFKLDEDKIYLNGYPKTGESVRNITNSGANLLAGTTTFAVIHKDGSASTTHAAAIVAKADDVIKFVTDPQISWETRTYTFTDD